MKAVRGEELAWLLIMLMSASTVEAADRLVDAVKNGDRAVVHSLLTARVDVDAVDADGSTALHWAVRADDQELVQALVRAGANVRASTPYGISPLSLAATNGSAAIIELLLEAGADPNAATPDGETPLMSAARTGRVEAAKALLDAGADPAARERGNGETALMWAAAENHGEMIRLLIARGAPVDGRSAALEFPDVKVDIALVWKVELPRGGMTPLMFAARQGAMASVQALADMGADLNLTDPDGTSALVIAIINAHYDVAAWLLDRGANPNVPDSAGMAALYAAVDMLHQEPLFNRPPPKPTGEMGALAIVKRLLDRGADPNLSLKTPLLARQHDAGDASLGAGATPLMRAAKAGDVQLMQLLIDKGAEPLRTLENGTTILMVAAAQGADGGVEETVKALELCLGRGVDINAANKNGETALHAAVGKDAAVIRFLAGKGAALDAKDVAGRTALDVALGAPARGREGRPGRRGPVHEESAAVLRELMGLTDATTGQSQQGR